MSTTLDLDDIQGLIIRGYRLPFARYYFLRIHPDEELVEGMQDAGDRAANRNCLDTDNEKARCFVAAVRDKVSVGSVQWQNKMPPEGATTNIAFTYSGLAALGIPAATLDGFPVEFQQGMKLRAGLLGDTGPSAPEKWDEVWQQGPVHIWISINAITKEALQAREDWLTALVKSSDGGISLSFIQDAGALKIDGEFSNKEHFGYSDGIGNPVFEGSGVENRPGRGKLDENGQWVPLKTGEFVLGYGDEGGETPPAPIPHAFSRNGTYMVYRKLHQRVKSFYDYFEAEAEKYPGGKGKLAAKWAGRWENGTPLELYPDEQPDLKDVPKLRMNDFTYLPQDQDGRRCPMGSHIRRANPRDSLGFNGKLANRRRIARRGLPYGAFQTPEERDDDGEHGIIFMALNANISRQFEFVQQQWMDYGNDFSVGDDKDALIGNNNGKSSRFLIQGDPDKGETPHFCLNLPHFVETRGGDYFFIPSMTALRLIANQAVNPL